VEGAECKGRGLGGDLVSSHIWRIVREGKHVAGLFRGCGGAARGGGEGWPNEDGEARREWGGLRSRGSGRDLLGSCGA